MLQKCLFRCNRIHTRGACVRIRSLLSAPRNSNVFAMGWDRHTHISKGENWEGGAKESWPRVFPSSHGFFSSSLVFLHGQREMDDEGGEKEGEKESEITLNNSVAPSRGGMLHKAPPRDNLRKCIYIARPRADSVTRIKSTVNYD